MTLLRRRSRARERLDEPGQDPAVLERSLEHVAGVNRFLGGRRALLDAVASAAADSRELRVLDLGTGSADLARALVDWGRRSRRRVTVTATDVHDAMLGFARSRCAAYPEIDLERADARALAFDDDSFDVVTASMMLHHLEDEDALVALREMARVCRDAVIVNELERCVPGYLGALSLALTVWSRNPITRHDGPLSVRRAYTPQELDALMRRAGLRQVRVRRRWAFRVVGTGRP